MVVFSNNEPRNHPLLLEDPRFLDIPFLSNFFDSHVKSSCLCSLLRRFQLLNPVDEEGEIAAGFRFIFERFCSLLD